MKAMVSAPEYGALQDIVNASSFGRDARPDPSDLDPIVFAPSNWSDLQDPRDDLGFGIGEPSETIHVGALNTTAAAACRSLLDTKPPAELAIEADALLRRLVEMLCDDPVVSGLFSDLPVAEPVFSALPTGLRSTTYCPIRKKYVGLHFDDFGGARKADPDTGSLRFSANIGSSPRHLCFVPVSFSEATEWAAAHVRKPASQQKQTGLAGLYCLFNSPTIYRVRIDPGHYYIAPTQNVIHDGQTPAESVDYTLSFRVRDGWQADAC